MPLHVKDGGTWRSVNQVYAKDGNTWREATRFYAKSSGTWRTVLDNYITGWGNVTNAENEVTWSSGTTINQPGQHTLAWPSGKNVFKATMKGAGGGNSNGGQGAAGGSTTLYLAQGSFDLLAVVGRAGEYGNPAGPYNRVCGNNIGNCSDNNHNNTNAREHGGRPGTGGSPHNWGSTGGGLSGIFLDDNNTTSPQGYRWFYCTPVAIAGGGGGGQAYNIHAQSGGGHSITQSTHYFTRSPAYTADEVIDINFTSDMDIDSNTGCYSGCRISPYTNSENMNPYLRAFDGSGGAGFASAGGPGAQGGTGMVYGLNSVHLSTLGYTRNPSSLTELSNAGPSGLVSPNSSTSNGNGSAQGVDGQVVYYWGTVSS
jgi:hypothetical protein